MALPRRRRRSRQRHRPCAGTLEWLVAEWPNGEKEPTKFFLAAIHKIGTKPLVRLLNVRWRTECVYEDLKGELGFDPIKGDSGLSDHGSGIRANGSRFSGGST